jgi:hypothetical protein
MKTRHDRTTTTTGSVVARDAEFSKPRRDLDGMGAIFMSERIAQLIGLVLGGLLTCTMVLSALAY